MDIPVGLNPYSNGICSMRLAEKRLFVGPFVVLILILMEYAL